MSNSFDLQYIIPGRAINFAGGQSPPNYGPGGKCPRHASILRRPCAYYSTRTLFTGCCKLQCVTAVNINYQRSPKTEQFMTAKISGTR